MLEVTKLAPQQAIKNLGKSFTKFFKKISDYPKLKRKNKNENFRIDNGPRIVGVNAIQTADKKIKVPKLGLVKMIEKLRFKGQIKSVVIFKRANR